MADGFSCYESSYNLLLDTDSSFELTSDSDDEIHSRVSNFQCVAVDAEKEDVHLPRRNASAIQQFEPYIPSKSAKTGIDSVSDSPRFVRFLYCPKEASPRNVNGEYSGETSSCISNERQMLSLGCTKNVPDEGSHSSKYENLQPLVEEELCKTNLVDNITKVSPLKEDLKEKMLEVLFSGIENSFLRRDCKTSGKCIEHQSFQKGLKHSDEERDRITESTAKKINSSIKKAEKPAEFDRDDCGNYSCPACLKTFHQSLRLKQHLSVHSQEYHNCETCGAKYLKHHRCRGKLFSHECNKCFKRFSVPDDLRHHTKTHHFEKLHVCNLCNTSFMTETFLENHMISHSNKRFICDDCGKAFSHKQVFRIHLRVHSKERPYECNLCKKRFSQKSNLNVHSRTHSREHPYLCPYCEKTFAHKSTYTSHLRTHTKERPFSCKICGKSFSHRGSLTNHQAVHSKVKKFKCRHCNREFTHLQSWQYHENNHTKSKT